MEQTPVLIVGGGLAGLTAASFLALYHIQCILIEKHERSSPHPRAVGFTTRTMEIFEKLGIVDQIPQTTADFRLRRMQVESLAGEWKGEMGQRNAAASSSMVQYSPFLGAAIAQDKLEPILRQRAKELGCDIRFGHRLLNLETASQGTDPVLASVREPNGREYTISARFVLAADGHRSSTREILKIGATGRGHLKTVRSVLFRAPLLDQYLGKGFHQFVISQPTLEAFLTTYNDSRWVLMFTDEKERNADELKAAILQATGVPSLEFEQIATGVWDLKAEIADTFSFPLTLQPNIFLLGDAAHTLPPTRGGYGANTGIADAHNIAWKLASVLNSHSKPELLASYDTERRPVAWFRHNQIFAGPDYAQYRNEGEDYGTLRVGTAVELGQAYNSDIIVDGPSPKSEPVVLQPDELAGRPGGRAPHVWLTSNGQRISTLSLLGNKWILVTANPGWEQVAAAANRQGAVPVEVLCVGKDNLKEETTGEFGQIFGLSEGAANLVRPDGFVAWRSTTPFDADGSITQLVGALRQAACVP